MNKLNYLSSFCFTEVVVVAVVDLALYQSSQNDWISVDVSTIAGFERIIGHIDNGMAFRRYAFVCALYSWWFDWTSYCNSDVDTHTDVHRCELERAVAIYRLSQNFCRITYTGTVSRPNVSICVFADCPICEMLWIDRHWNRMLILKWHGIMITRQIYLTDRYRTRTASPWCASTWHVIWVLSVVYTLWCETKQIAIVIVARQQSVTADSHLFRNTNTSVYTCRLYVIPCVRCEYVCWYNETEDITTGRFHRLLLTPNSVSWWMLPYKYRIWMISLADGMTYVACSRSHFWRLAEIETNICDICMFLVRRRSLPSRPSLCSHRPDPFRRHCECGQRTLISHLKRDAVLNGFTCFRFLLFSGSSANALVRERLSLLLLLCRPAIDNDHHYTNSCRILLHPSIQLNHRRRRTHRIYPLWRWANAVQSIRAVLRRLLRTFFETEMPPEVCKCICDTLSVVSHPPNWTVNDRRSLSVCCNLRQ